MRLIAALSLVLVTAGCMAHLMGLTPGDIQTKKSEFDGATTVFMMPALLCKEGAFGGCLEKLGLSKTSTMKPDEFLITAQVVGLVHIPEEKSLQFRIDEEIVSLSSIDSKTTYGYDINHNPYSLRGYLTDRSLIERLIKGQRVVVRIVTESGNRESIFSQDTMYSARPAFRKFLAEADQKFAK